MHGSLPGIQSGSSPDQRDPEHATYLTRRNFLLGFASAAVGMGLYSTEIARHEISILTRTIRIAGLPEAFHNYRIVQISDIHFDEYTEPAFVQRIVTHVNRLAPSLLLLTGDFASHGPLPNSFGAQAAYRCAEVLRALTCPQRFACMGNHDTTIGVSIVTDALSHADIPVLLNRFVPIELDGQRLWLCGIADAGTGEPDLRAAIPAHPDGPVILMSHSPDYADTVANHPRGHLVDFMLSGHTHGGQVRLPFVGPVILPTWGKKYVEGLYRFDRLQLYVNRGIGTVGIPLRLNCPPEITVFTLEGSSTSIRS